MEKMVFGGGSTVNAMGHPNSFFFFFFLLTAFEFVCCNQIAFLTGGKKKKKFSPTGARRIFLFGLFPRFRYTPFQVLVSFCFERKVMIHNSGNIIDHTRGNSYALFPRTFFLKIYLLDSIDILFFIYTVEEEKVNHFRFLVTIYLSVLLYI